MKIFVSCIFFLISYFYIFKDAILFEKIEKKCYSNCCSEI